MAVHPLFGEVSDDFNEAEALKAYEFFKSEPEYAWALLQIHAHERVSEVVKNYPEVIDDLIHKKFEERAQMVKDAVINGVVSKSMSDKTIDEIAATMDIIKADYSSWERSLAADKQRRDIRGRFVPMGTTKIDYPNMGLSDTDRKWIQVRDSYDRVTMSRAPGASISDQISGPSGSVSQNRKKDAYLSAAWLQVVEDLTRMTDQPLIADVTYSDGTRKTSTPDEVINDKDFRSGKYPTRVKWYGDQDIDTGDAKYGTGYDILTGAGMSSRTYDNLYTVGSNVTDGTGAYNTRLGQDMAGNNEYGATNRGYRQLGATAEMVDTLGGSALSPKAKWALGAAKYVGNHGPEAEQVLGPTARKTAYRYRGVERKPDPKMERAILASVQGSKSIDDAREKLIHPRLTDQVDYDPDKSTGKYSQDFEFSPFIRYWQSQLPKREHLNLHLASGAIAPSQGVVFDAKGQVVTQAVGYGDDHYLPFNLRKLSMANRGEWVRTRTMGGPTTEDIYAALITGTRSITVVSHSGVYNVEFSPDFRGGRRFNDKSARMTRRYAQLLDTLEAENTTLQSVPPDRVAELEAKVKREIPGDTPMAQQAQKDRLNQYKNAEKNNPQPSQATKDAWTAEFGQVTADKVNEAYARNQALDDDLAWEQIRAQQSIKAGKQLTDAEVIEQMGLSKEYTRFMEAKTREYRATQQPLKLNGQGYYFALQALQEQFPYYIERVEWYPPNEGGGSIGGKDLGYVKANFLRPAAAKEGFWDAEIEGFVGEEKTRNKKGEEVQTGKNPAHHTNYQNWQNRQRLNSTPPARGGNDADTDANAPTPPGGNEPAPPVPPNAAGLVLNRTPTARVYGTNQTARAVETLGDMIAGVEVPVTNAAGGQPVPTPFGEIRDESNPLTNWRETKVKIQSGDRRALNESVEALIRLFENNGQNSRALNQANPEAAKFYRENVAPTIIRDLPSSFSEAIASPYLFAFPGSNENLFLPGRSDEEYVSAASDPDVVEWKERSKVFSDFPADYRAMEDFVRTPVKGKTVRYGGRDWYQQEFDELVPLARRDAMGYLKTRQLERVGGVIPSADVPEDVSEIERINAEEEKNLDPQIRRVLENQQRRREEPNYYEKVNQAIDSGDDPSKIARPTDLPKPTPAPKGTVQINAAPKRRATPEQEAEQRLIVLYRDQRYKDYAGRAVPGNNYKRAINGLPADIPVRSQAEFEKEHPLNRNEYEKWKRDHPEIVEPILRRYDLIKRFSGKFVLMPYGR